MSTSPSKTLSPAELAKLEHAFASDPSSDAYKPLAEAYLGMGRFMEAMVVCKKGVKAHPTEVDPRLLLARVYADQGKDKKALEEALGALQVRPEDAQALRTVGALQLKTGEAEVGKANLLKAFAAAPADAQTLGIFAQYKIEVPQAAAPPPPPPAPVPVAAPGINTSGPPVLVPSGPPPPTNGAVVHALPPPPPPVAGPARAAPRPAPRRARLETDSSDDIHVEDEEPAYRAPPRAKSGSSRSLALVLLVALPVAVIGYAVFGRWSAQRNREFKKILATATDELKHDSYESYKKASEAADRALELDPDSTAAHGYLAYAYAIRWGEHGSGDDARAKAQEHLDAAKNGGDVSSHLYAAEALLQTYSGQGVAALSSLEARVKAFDAEGKQSSLLYLTLGLIQMNAGDLSRALDSLGKAQSLAPDDPRIYAALGSLYRRLGDDRKAWANYEFALRYEGNHPESLLGQSLLMLEQEAPEYYVKAAKMLRQLLDSNPPPSPRQLATAHLARSLLVARVEREMSNWKSDVQSRVLQETGISSDREKARAEIAKSEETGFALDRKNPELLVIKGRRLFVEGQFDAAATEIRKAIDLDRTRAQFYVELARSLMAKPGGEKEAAEALSTALKTMGPSPKLIVMLGNAYRRLGKMDEALAEYQKATSDPKAKNPEAWLAMGTLSREKGDLVRAQTALEKASVEFISQPNRAALALTELGRVHLARNEQVKAEDAFKRALNTDENFAPAYYFYGMALSKDRKTVDKGRTLVQEYLKRDPKGEYVADAQGLLE